MHTLKTKLILGVVAGSLCVGSSALANELTNPGFEQNVGAYNNGNNFPPSVIGWTFGSGQSPNVVKVDGPGGYNYSHNGPESDAQSSTGAGINQHYLDIANGSNSFYQTFTPKCSGTVKFGGAFSTRANGRARASIAIRSGSGTSGTIVGTTNTTVMPGGTSKTDPWTRVDYTTSLAAGQTYSFVVTMDNNSNFDDAYVTFKTDCTNPNVNMCCPPWTKKSLEGTLQVVPGPGGLGANFGVNYQTVGTLNTQMQAYANYISTVNSSFGSLRVDYTASAHGTSVAPSSGSSGVPGAGQNSLTYTGSSVSSPAFWNGYPFQVNTWYKFSSHVSARDVNGKELELFGEKCEDQSVFYRIQLMRAPMARQYGSNRNVAPQSRMVLQTSDGRRITSSKPIEMKTTVPTLVRPRKELKKLRQRFKR